MLATYDGDAAPLYAQLNSVPADIIALDFASSATLAEVIVSTGASKELGLGLVDGRSPLLEDPQQVAADVRAVLRRYPFEQIHLLPSCGLGSLPRDYARAKLAHLAAIHRHISA